jgi:uncharacterized membrane protein
VTSKLDRILLPLVFLPGCLLGPLLCAQSQPQGPPQHYQIVAIPLRPAHISNSGEVVGSTESNRPAVWSKQNGLKKLPSAAGFSLGEARTSNAKGQVVGSMMSSDESTSRAFLYEHGKSLLLSGENSKALAINDAGDIAGQAIVRGKIPSTPVLWKQGAPLDLGGCCGGIANALNNNGQVTGHLYAVQGRYRAFLWDQSHGVHLLGPADAFSSAIAINDQGNIVLQEFDKGLFLYKNPNTSVQIVTPPKFPAEVHAMNNKNIVVGAFGPFSDANHAFRWDEKSGFADLNNLIATGSGWKLEAATGINDQGQIVGVGDYKGNDDAGFLLTPEDATPEAAIKDKPEP